MAWSEDHRKHKCQIIIHKHARWGREGLSAFNHGQSFTVEKGVAGAFNQRDGDEMSRTIQMEHHSGMPALA